VKLLGVALDRTLSFDQHVSNVVCSCTYYARALKHIRPLITIDGAKMIASSSSIVGARLDYFNRLLFGTTACNLDRLERVQNTLARFVLQKPFQHTQQNFDRSYTGCRLGSLLSTKSLRILTRRITLVYRSSYTIFFTTTRQ